MYVPESRGLVSSPDVCTVPVASAVVVPPPRDWNLPSVIIYICLTTRRFILWRKELLQKSTHTHIENMPLPIFVGAYIVHTHFCNNSRWMSSDLYICIPYCRYRSVKQEDTQVIESKHSLKYMPIIFMETANRHLGNSSHCPQCSNMIQTFNSCSILHFESPLFIPPFRWNTIKYLRKRTHPQCTYMYIYIAYTCTCITISNMTISETIR